MMPNRKSVRLKAHDYGVRGTYFVTLCTKQRVRCFSEIVNSKVKLLLAGEIVDACIEKVPQFYDYASIPEYVIMPDHIHLLIDIELPFKPKTELKPNEFGPLKQGVAQVVRGLKAGATSKARKEDIDINWVSRYYCEHIYTAERRKVVIKYIRANPRRWLL